MSIHPGREIIRRLHVNRRPPPIVKAPFDVVLRTQACKRKLAKMLAHIVVLLGLMAGEAVRPTGATPENQLVFQLAALAAEERPLHGRFLHFTDIHPDRYYTPGAKVNDACHGKDRDAQVKEESQSSRKKYSSSRTESRTKIKKDRAGFWGTGNR